MYSSFKCPHHGELDPVELEGKRANWTPQGVAITPVVRTVLDSESVVVKRLFRSYRTFLGVDPVRQTIENIGMVSTSLLAEHEWIGWRSVTMTQTKNPTSYRQGADFGNMVLDGEWHYRCINIYQQLQASGNCREDNPNIAAVIWHNGGGVSYPRGPGHFHIDEFSIGHVPVEVGVAGELVLDLALHALEVFVRPRVDAVLRGRAR